MQGLSKSFGVRTVLRSARVEIPPGVTLLIGSNGAGKSTLVAILEGLVRPDEGRVLLNGFDPRRDPTLVFQSATFLPERPIFLSDDSLLEHFEIQSGLRNSTPTRARSFLSEWNFEHLLDVPPGKLSLGESQIASVCGALGSDTNWYVLDEPNANLDASARMHLAGCISDLATSQGKNFLITTHVTDDILAACDNLVALRDGSMVGPLPTAELTSVPGQSVISVNSRNASVLANALKESGLTVARRGSVVTVHGSTLVLVLPLLLRFSADVISLSVSPRIR